MNRQGSEKKKVHVGLSGGVDSSVSAALLKERGFDVTGVFIKVWQPDFVECQWKEDRLDAMRVAAHLGIPFETLDLEDEYKKEVVDYMVGEYKAGRTPNPDVMCNMHIKFGAFYRWVLKQGGDFVATGHYARAVERLKIKDLSKKETALTTGNFNLLTAVDSAKDQSYFLWTLTPEILSRTLFPVGELEKKEVRQLAKRFGLITAEKKDSQGLCFVGKVDMKEFLKNFIEEKKGDVLNLNGEKIGDHDGSFFFTLGERHGFRITKKTPHESPYYVVSKDIDKNTITVANKTEGELPEKRAEISISKANWIVSPEINREYFGRARYRQTLFPLKIKKIGNGSAQIEFKDPQSGIANGQSLVIYDGEVCVGGGIID